MNEWLILALICAVFLVSWLLAFFALKRLVNWAGRWLERRQQRAKSRPRRLVGL